ncbi:MAG: zf-HC2 domain-containing protein [Anaerolineales bacterium]|nr:zf-HC2 domain-containing protein [Anaerolineales bacterium]
MDKFEHLTDACLNEYLDAALDSQQRQMLEAHLQECQTCADRLAELRLVFAALQRLPDEPLEHDLTPNVLRAIGGARLGTAALPYSLKLGFAAQALLALVLLAVFWPVIASQVSLSLAAWAGGWTGLLAPVEFQQGLLEWQQLILQAESWLEQTTQAWQRVLAEPIVMQTPLATLVILMILAGAAWWAANWLLLRSRRLS